MNLFFIKLMPEGMECWHIICLRMAVMEATILPISQQKIFGQGKKYQDLGLPAEGFDIILAEKSLAEGGKRIGEDAKSEKIGVSNLIPSLFPVALTS